ncbi:type 1 glutamine amidotransferase domain-containing protein [Candidatus Riflebacteria bacterium]
MNRIAGLFLIFIFCCALNLNAATNNKILMVLSNISKIPGTQMQTGVWAEELIVPFEIFTKAGYEVVLASPRGGAFVFDKSSCNAKTVGPAMAEKTKNFLAGQKRSFTRITLPLRDVIVDEYAAFFVAGGHGVMFDVAYDKSLSSLTAQFLKKGKVVAAVCHGPCFLGRARDEEGNFVIRGYRVTGFSNKEEQAIKMDAHMPFSLEDGLNMASGNLFEAGDKWKSFVVVDRNLVTGQNPASSEKVAHTVLQLLGVAPGKRVYRLFLGKKYAGSKHSWFLQKNIVNGPENIIMGLTPEKALSELPHAFALVSFSSKNVYDRYKKSGLRKKGTWSFPGDIYWTLDLALAPFTPKIPIAEYVAYDLIGKPADWSKGYRTFFIGRRKKDYPAENFMSHLHRHVSMGRREMSPFGLKGYVIYASRDFEMAIMVWQSKEHANRGFSSEQGKRIIADANSFMKGEVFTEIK